MNPFLERQKNRGIGGAGRLSEVRVAASMGAKLKPASGAMTGAKGDATLEDFLLEMKSTKLQSIAIQVGWLSKISQEAVTTGKIPAVVLSFVSEDGKPQMKYNSEWVCIPKAIFMERLIK